ncbi:MAG: trehalose-phosphatase [Egibacteraceae bacterium]
MSRAAIRDLPSAVDRAAEIAERLAGVTPAVFLDYDGTLTPIVEHAADATLPASTREAIRALAAVVPVAIVSGRDLADVRAMVGIDGIAYAGSHGFDIVEPDGARHERAPEALPALDRAQTALEDVLGAIPGVSVERKRFAVAVHFRQADPARVQAIEEAVDQAVTAAEGQLRKTGGKKIFEVRPAVAWDKGKALRWLLDALGLDRPDVVPLYVGDDVTDEDAFDAIAADGIGVVVCGEDDARTTAAHYRLDTPDQVRDLLDGLVPDGGSVSGPDPC